MTDNDGSPGVPGIARRTLKNSVSGIAGFAWPLLIAVFTTPFVVHQLGADLYGIFSIVGITLGLFGFMDLGIGGAAIRQIAQHFERDEHQSISRVVSTVIAFYLVVGVAVGFLILVLTGTLVSDVLRVPRDLQHVATIAFFVAAPSFASSLLVNAFLSVPSALQRMDISTALQMSLTTLNAILMVLLLHLDYGVVAVMVAGLVVNVVMLPVCYAVARRLVPAIVLRPTWDPVLMRELFEFGGYYVLSSVGVWLLYQLDKLLISRFLGVESVTYYVLPSTLAQKIQGLAAAAGGVVFPMSAALFGSEQRDTVIKLYKEGTRAIFILVTMAAVPSAVFADKFLRFWVGAEMGSRSAFPMVLLVVTYSFLAVTTVPWNITLGLGKARVNALFTIAIAVVNVGLFLVLVGPMKVTGAALAYLISAVLGAPVLISYIERRLLGLSGVEFVRIYWRVGVVAGVQAVISILARPLAVNLVATIALMVSAAGVFVLVYAALGFVQEGDRRLISLVASAFGSKRRSSKQEA